MIQNDTAKGATCFRPAFEVRIAQTAWTRLATAHVPRSSDDQGGRLFGVDNALRYAIIRYLCQGQALPSTTPGTRSAVTTLSLSLPPDLYRVVEERADAEQRSVAALVRAAVTFAFPPALLPLPGEDCAASPALTTRRSLAAALAMAPIALPELAEIFA